MDNKQIYADDINNASANATSKLCELLNIEDKHWEKIYNTLLNTLNEILEHPDYKNNN